MNVNVGEGFFSTHEMSIWCQLRKGVVFCALHLHVRTEDPDTMEFCKAVQTRELQLLFEHIMSTPAPDDPAPA